MGTFGRNTGVRKIVRRSGSHFPFIRLHTASHGEKYKWESSSGLMYSPLTWKPPRMEGERHGDCCANRPGRSSPPDPNAHRRTHELHVHRCRETPAHTPSIPGPTDFLPPGDNLFRHGDSRSADRSRQPQYQRVLGSLRPLDRTFPLPHPVLAWGHVPRCPKTRGFWNIAPESPCSRQLQIPGILEHGAGSVGRKKCSLDGSLQDQGRPCDTPLLTHTDLPFSPSNCCTRVGRHFRVPWVAALKGGSPCDPPL